MPFKLIPARHRLGLLTPELLDKVLVARRHFQEKLPEHLRGAIAFFDPGAYNGPSSIQDNVIFGKIAYGQAQAGARITELLTDVLDELGLRQRVIQVGLDAPCGVAGGRLSPAQRQKLAVAREEWSKHFDHVLKLNEGHVTAVGGPAPPDEEPAPVRELEPVS
jgi:putative ABC transport system ATP-binding protein